MLDRWCKEELSVSIQGKNWEMQDDVRCHRRDVVRCRTCDTKVGGEVPNSGSEERD